MPSKTTAAESNQAQVHWIKWTSKLAFNNWIGWGREEKKNKKPLAKWFDDRQSMMRISKLHSIWLGSVPPITTHMQLHQNEWELVSCSQLKSLRKWQINWIPKQWTKVKYRIIAGKDLLLDSNRSFHYNYRLIAHKWKAWQRSIYKVTLATSNKMLPIPSLTRSSGCSEAVNRSTRNTCQYFV